MVAVCVLFCFSMSRARLVQIPPPSMWTWSLCGTTGKTQRPVTTQTNPRDHPRGKWVIPMRAHGYHVFCFRVRLVERGAPQSLPLMESGTVSIELSEQNWKYLLFVIIKYYRGALSKDWRCVAVCVMITLSQKYIDIDIDSYWVRLVYEKCFMNKVALPWTSKLKWLCSGGQILPGVRVIIVNPETRGPLGDSHLGEVSGQEHAGQT